MDTRSTTGRTGVLNAEEFDLVWEEEQTPGPDGSLFEGDPEEDEILVLPNPENRTEQGNLFGFGDLMEIEEEELIMGRPTGADEIATVADIPNPDEVMIDDCGPGDPMPGFLEMQGGEAETIG